MVLGSIIIIIKSVASRNANWIGHILRKNCLHDAIEGQMMEVEGVGRRRRT